MRVGDYSEWSGNLLVLGRCQHQEGFAAMCPVPTDSTTQHDMGGAKKPQPARGGGGGVWLRSTLHDRTPQSSVKAECKCVSLIRDRVRLTALQKLPEVPVSYQRCLSATRGACRKSCRGGQVFEAVPIRVLGLASEHYLA